MHLRSKGWKKIKKERSQLSNKIKFSIGNGGRVRFGKVSVQG